MRKLIYLLLYIFGFVYSVFGQTNSNQKVNNIKGIPGPLILSAEGGMTFGITEYDIKPDGMAGLSLEYLLNRGAQVALGLKLFGSAGYISGGYGIHRPQGYPLSFRTMVANAGVELVYNHFISSVFFPYLGVGFSQLWFDPRYFNGRRLPNNVIYGYKRTDVNLNADVGVKFYTAAPVSINLGIRGNMNFNDFLDDVSSGYWDDSFYFVYAGVSLYLFGEKDNDKDGVLDSRDVCPGTPRGVSVDIMGCPEDSDKDHIANYLDRCPSTPPGVKVDIYGCPIDSDEDGVPDYKDKCNGTPGNISVTDDGCPIDSDKDGVPDYRDNCPDTEINIAVDYDGCALDKDRDGVPDSHDTCPDTPMDVKVDSTGCPEIKILPKEIILSGGTTFESGSSVLQPSAFPILDKLVEMMVAFPDSRWRIEGHSDNEGSEKSNREISYARALSVQNYFVFQGIERSRLEIIGVGSEQPIADNSTSEGRAQNRRVVIYRVD